MFACTCVHLRVFLCALACTCVRFCVHLRAPACVFVGICVHLRAFLRAPACTCVYFCVHLRLIFCVFLSESTVDRIHYEEIYPIHPLSSETRRIEFNVKAVPYWTDLAETSLFITVRIQLSNGNNLPPATPEPAPANPDAYKACGFIQNPESALFKDFIYRLNEVNLTSTSNCYAHIGYQQNLLGFSTLAKNRKLQVGGW